MSVDIIEPPLYPPMGGSTKHTSKNTKIINDPILTYRKNNLSSTKFSPLMVCDGWIINVKVDIWGLDTFLFCFKYYCREKGDFLLAFITLKTSGLNHKSRLHHFVLPVTCKQLLLYEVILQTNKHIRHTMLSFYYIWLFSSTAKKKFDFYVKIKAWCSC